MGEAKRRRERGDYPSGAAVAPRPLLIVDATERGIGQPPRQAIPVWGWATVSVEPDGGARTRVPVCVADLTARPDVREAGQRQRAATEGGHTITGFMQLGDTVLCDVDVTRPTRCRFHLLIPTAYDDLLEEVLATGYMALAHAPIGVEPDPTRYAAEMLVWRASTKLLAEALAAAV